MYVETIKLTNSDMVRLRNGTLRLRCGQWVVLPYDTRKSRWVGTLKGDAQHRQFLAMAQSRSMFLPVNE